MSEAAATSSSPPHTHLEDQSAKKGKTGASAEVKNPRPRKSDDMDTRISKKFTFLLRHGAEKAGLAMKADGYSLVSDMLKCAQLDRSVDEEKVLEIVATDKKSRFGILRDDSGALWIRANQGHTVASVDREELLKKIENAREYPLCIHGTSLKAWESIKHTGLCRMRRNEIHCAKGEFGTVLSGFRESTQVVIHINLEKCLEHGVPWYESENGVLLTPGIGPKGIIPTGFFSKVIEVKTLKDLAFVPNVDLPSELDEAGPS